LNLLSRLSPEEPPVGVRLEPDQRVVMCLDSTCPGKSDEAAGTLYLRILECQGGTGLPAAV